MEHIVEFGWSVDLCISIQKTYWNRKPRIRSMPIPVVIDHIARVKPAEGLDQPAFQLLLDLLKAKHVWSESERRGQDLQYERCILISACRSLK